MARIALDYTAAYEQGGGIGRYVRELTDALARFDQSGDYRLFVAGTSHVSLPPSPAANFVWRPTRISPRWLARVWHRAQLPLPVEVFTGKVDLFHATDFVLPPTLPGTRTLLTVHDLSFVRVPQAADPALRTYLELVVPRSVQAADHILADSQATKDDLIKLYATPAEKITVLYCGVDARFAPVKDGEILSSVLGRYKLDEKKYLLSVGTVQPRKNYGTVIRALGDLRQRGLDLHYAIAGGRGWLEDELYQTIRQTGLQDRVHLLGFVEDSDLPALYSGARALITASLYEGFGLPLLEAMACGTPVVTSNLSSLPEVAGKAGILVDPAETNEISEAIHRLESDDEYRNRLIELGFQRARGFTWESSARQLKAVYDTLLDR